MEGRYQGPMSGVAWVGCICPLVGTEKECLIEGRLCSAKGEQRIAELQKLRMTLNLVQSTEGAKHYKDGNGNRLVLYPDGSYGVELVE